MMCKVAIISVLVALTLHSLATATPVAEPQMTTVGGAVAGLGANATGTVGGLATGAVGATTETVGNLVGLLGNILAPLITALNDTVTKVVAVPAPIFSFLG